MDTTENGFDLVLSDNDSWEMVGMVWTAGWFRGGRERKRGERERENQLVKEVENEDQPPPWFEFETPALIKLRRGPRLPPPPLRRRQLFTFRFISPFFNKLSS